MSGSVHVCQECGSVHHHTSQHEAVVVAAGKMLKDAASRYPVQVGDAKMKICYCVTQRNGKTFWNRIGVAFYNNDGSLNVKLEAIPVNGEIQIRDYIPQDVADNSTASEES